MLKAVLLLAGLVSAVAMAAPGYLLGLTGRTAKAPVAPPPTAAAISSAARIAANSNGQFFTDVEINFRRFPALIDTGATLVALRYQDARALGLVYPGDRFDVRVRTANGEGRARRVSLRSVAVASITVHDVDALVLEEGALGVNLVGMSFLGKLSRFEVERGTLVLQR